MASAQPDSLSNRVLWYLERAEASEENPHYCDDLRIAWITVKLASEGESHPHFWATMRVLRLPPECVWPAILERRRVLLGSNYEQFFGVNLPPKKPAASERLNGKAVKTIAA